MAALGPYVGKDLTDLVAWLGEEYDNVRVLEDGTIIGTSDLMFTRALYIGMDRYGWEKRFCFEDRNQALIELENIKTGEDEPSPGSYVARRGA